MGMIIGIAGLLALAALMIYNIYKFKQAESKYPPRGQFVTVHGVRLHYLCKGKGKAVVFLHGGVLCSSDFTEAMDLAAAQGYQALAFDRPGYGHSGRLGREHASPLAQARLIHDALQELGIQKPIVVGHSWSGTLVMAYALLYGDEVEGVITLGAMMYKEGYPAEHGDPISKLVTTPVLGRLLLYTLLQSPLGTMMAKRITAETFSPEAAPSGYVEAVLSLWFRPGQFRANREDVLAFAPAAISIQHRYPEIRLPVVIVAGEQDPFGTKEQALRLQRDIPHAQLVVLPQAAHMIPQNHPAEVMEALLRLSAIH